MREIHGLRASAARDKLRNTEGFQDLAHLIDALKD